MILCLPTQKLHEILRMLRYRVVTEDVFSEDHPIPVEPSGPLETEEEFLICSDTEMKGRLLIWEMHVGGAGPLYGDSTIFDFVCDLNFYREFVDAAKIAFRKAEIEVEEVMNKK